MAHLEQGLDHEGEGSQGRHSQHLASEVQRGLYAVQSAQRDVDLSAAAAHTRLQAMSVIIELGTTMVLSAMVASCLV